MYSGENNSHSLSCCPDELSWILEVVGYFNVCFKSIMPYRISLAVATKTIEVFCSFESYTFDRICMIIFSCPSLMLCHGL